MVQVDQSEELQGCVEDKAETKIRSQIMDGVKGSLECWTKNMEFF